MSSPAPSSDLGARESYVDWDELSGLDQVVTIYQVGVNTVVLETSDSREVRITALFDRRSGQYVADLLCHHVGMPELMRELGRDEEVLPLAI